MEREYKISDEFKDPKFRKKVYEHLISDFESQLSNGPNDSDFPWICSVICNTPWIDDHIIARPMGAAISPSPLSYVPLHILLPELRRPRTLTKDAAFWYGGDMTREDKLNKRIGNCKRALTRVEKIINSK